ncbi:hypothetical protein AJ79_01688 [Helicocarpus griseus UAMH5409]|uniref:RING-type E3 ubiquitin transferase n=1 Tax=Helicocarpus griseus UAMH5409 TaxID=1447875 RepID=A0A2B7Y6R8_9EURO|nr:hypothetical protein AJ79_01688 [Helicocarpus griseus UAMH5409]
MAQDVDLQQTILRRTLDEVADSRSSGKNDAHLNPCVICLDQISEPAIALPCNHASFDFLCLLSWLQQRPACPLCKAPITRVQYTHQSVPKIYHLPPPSQPHPSPTTAPTRPFHPLPRRHRPRRPRSPPPPSDPLIRRRHIYRHTLYSLRVGTNRLSQYRELTPAHFNADPTLLSRARKWIRRELQVFEFLNPTTASSSDSEGGTGGGAGLASSNAEFLLEYIIAILRTVDIRGSGGQAEELLREFLGRENARLFLHELYAWLRSPYTELGDWDRAVQYAEPVGVGAEGVGRDARAVDGDGRLMSRPASLSFTARDGGGGAGGRGRSCPGSMGRVSKATAARSGSRGYASSGSSGTRYDSASRARRIQRARDRYQPD